MQKYLRTGAVSLAIVVLTIGGLGCGLKNGGFEIGPIPLSMPIMSGTLDPSMFAGAEGLPIALGSFEQEVCTLPTEAQVVAAFQQASGNSSFVELSRIELRKSVVVASSGDFETLKALQLYFIPKLGSIFNRVNLGGAFSVLGFADTVELEPSDAVDLLDIIRENDAMPGAQCPTVEVKAAGSAPKEPIAWQATLEVDAYARLDIF